MQAAPRKGKNTLKSVHGEQLTKLQHKHQQELDLLDDIRLFSKQRAAVEKDYAQALVKLGEQFLSRRKFPPPPNFKSEDGKDYRTVWTVWKTVLEETRRVGEMRMQAADTYLQQISDPAKPLKSSKSQVAKKVFEQCNTLQRELNSTVQDMTKSNKVYSEEEHIAHDARAKATEAEAKVKNRSTGLFTSLAKLQQASNKLNLRREGCEVKSTSARNDYLINLAAANAHSSRFYNTELPLLIKTLDGEMYEKVQDYFTTLARSELECCGLTQECFMKILTDACLVSREFNLQCFLHENKVFTDCIQYKYEAQEDDSINTVRTEHNAKEQVENETRKWATAFAQESNRLEKGLKNVQILEDQIANGDVKSCQSGEGGKSDKNDKSSVSSTIDPEQKMEDLKNSIRKAETNKLKAEAVLEILRSSGIEVDKWLEKAEAEVAKQQEEDDQRRLQTTTPPSKTLEASVMKKSRTESENTGSETQSIHNTSTSRALGDSTYINYEEDDYVDEAFESSPHAAAQQAESASLSTGYASMTASGRTYPLPCVALYDFQAGNSDELNLTEHEQLEVIADGEGDGWLRARKADGQEGLVPENYIHIYTDQVNGDVDQNEMNVDQNEMNVDRDIPVQQQHSAPSSAGYNTTQVNVAWDAAQVNTQWDSTHNSTESGHFSSHNGNENTDTLGSGMSTYSSTDYEVQQTVAAEQPNTQDGDWVKAMYDYDATCEEELSFQEGQLIRITRRDENGVDDGWWEGEINGKIGVFPSLVVEELSCVNDVKNANTPDRPGPPSFLPPAPQLEFTLPSPDEHHSQNGEGKESEDGKKEEASTEDIKEDGVDSSTTDNTEVDDTIKNVTENIDELADADKTAVLGSQVTVEADVHVLDNSSTNKTTSESGKSTEKKEQVLKLDDEIAFADDDDNAESVI